MGAAFYPVFEDRSDGWPDDVNGKCLSRAADKLDKICRSRKVRTLYDFYSMTRDQAITELLDGDPEDPTSYDNNKLPEEVWYDSHEGLETVRVLLEHVRGNDVNLDDHECVVADLEVLERHLADAVRRNARWHLVVDA